MLASPLKALPGGTAALIAGLTVVLLAAMAAALPPSPIAVRPDTVERGYLVRHSMMSDRLAELKAAEGYTFLAVDLTDARFDDPQALWRDHFDLVAQRRFPLWAWVDVTRGAGQAHEVLRSLTVSGVLVYGKDAVDVAAALRRERPALNVVPVLPVGSAPIDGDYAVVAEPDRFADVSASGAMAVLVADQLPMTKVQELRRAAEGRYVVAEIPIFPPR